MEGYLIKRAMKSGRNWKKRYFLLQGNTLNYFKKPNGQLRGTLMLEASSIARNSNVKPNAFEVKTNTAALYAYAPSETERDRWVQHLTKVILDLNTSATTSTSRAANNTKASAASTTNNSSASSLSTSNNTNTTQSSHSDNDTYIFAVSGTTFEVTKNYKLIKPIGQGAYGVVISALDQTTRKKVAIKKVTRAFEDTIDAKRILRELCLLRHFDHENIVSVMDICRPLSVASFEDVYIVSELMETDLHRVIYSKQNLTDEHVQYFLYQLLRGLKYMHSANVLHRDLKPSNLLVNANCDLKICDFGLSRGMEQEDAEHDEDMTEYVVTRWYRAPEIMLAVKTYGPPVDMWAVGCIFGELMGRKPLFPGNDYIHQLRIIQDVVGKPSEEELGFITSDKAKRFMEKQRVKEKVPWDKVYPKYVTVQPGPPVCDEAFDLLDKMLQFDPRKRLSVEDALRHPYLKTLHHEDDEPVCEKPFKFDFKKDDLTKSRLQEKMYEVAMGFKK